MSFFCFFFFFFYYYSFSSSVTIMVVVGFGGRPLPDRRHVTAYNNNPGGPIKLQSKMEGLAKGIPRASTSNHIHRPTNKSHVKTWDHSSATKLG
jgi:hypothetical protein